MGTIEQKQALRRFHALCGALGMSAEDKRALICGAGAESSTDLPVWKLQAICERLQGQVNPQAAKMDAMRKRVMASIGGWLKVAGIVSNAAIIKAIACRSTGYDDFNKIPAGRLNNIYNNFRNKQIDRLAAETLQREIVGSRVDVAELVTRYFTKDSLMVN